MREIEEEEEAQRHLYKCRSNTIVQSLESRLGKKRKKRGFLCVSDEALTFPAKNSALIFAHFFFLWL